MATGFVLLDNRTREVQCRHPRRARLSGMVGVHTAEGVMDSVGIDTGAENVASFIVGRADYGSYHEIVDSDSFVRMAPDDYETWHIGADMHNWHSWGISAACRTVDWNPDSAWTKATIATMGERICAFWMRNGFDVEALAGRWLTRDEALRHLPGLIEHGVAQPGDRSDAWATRPDRATLRQMLTDAILAAYRRITGTTPTPPPTTTPEDDDMAREVWHHANAQRDYLVAGTTRRHIRDSADGSVKAQDIRASHLKHGAIDKTGVDPIEAVQFLEGLTEVD